MSKTMNSPMVSLQVLKNLAKVMRQNNTEYITLPDLENAIQFAEGVVNGKVAPQYTD